MLQVLLGAALLHITLFSDLYLRYVRRALQPYLVATGVLLVLAGLVSAVAVVRDLLRPDAGERVTEHHDHDHGHGHDQGHGGSRIGWLLVLPVAAIFLIAPDALGAFTAQRSDSTAAEPAPAAGFAPLPAGDPLPIRLADFDARAVWDSSAALAGRRVRLTGFATPKKDGGGWYLARLTITCCAADAQTSKVEILGTSAPPEGVWVQVTGVWQPGNAAGGSGAVPALTVQQVVTVPEPGDPYE